MDIGKIRKEYGNVPLGKDDLSANPFEQLRHWLEDAEKAQVMELNAMVIATASREGIPTSRVVLLKKLDDDSLHFFTNLESRKACDISENPHISATFFWKELDRQVNIEGIAEPVGKDEAELYFHMRPRGSQIGAWASRQDTVIESRQQLIDAFDRYVKVFDKKEVPLPDYWGGYRIIPSRFTFWQGRKDRLHDRFRYSLSGSKWTIERLSP
ncbi:MAG: pyridoxamine 5'-phosphate oxidase [Chlamydiales bacterium]|nr:pyridoxamine 5'-phosphate oxidase [Chlamydiia bacterium]MCP5507737.1 pyridoxamine 5'-phosphate oxidase [Chlamydiales bacterium]